MRRKNPKNYTPRVTFSIEEGELENILEWKCDELLDLVYIGRQINTPAGIIDILARHPIHSDLYFVIELKKDGLDSAAFCQVHRYASYLNASYNKDGKRLFIPLLIGKKISDEISRCVYAFDHTDMPPSGRPSYFLGKTFYSLYEMHPTEGIAFNYFNVAQKRYQDDNLQDCMTSYHEAELMRIHALVGEVEAELGRAHAEIETLKGQSYQEQSAAKLTVVK